MDLRHDGRPLRGRRAVGPAADRRRAGDRRRRRPGPGAPGRDGRGAHRPRHDAARQLAVDSPAVHRRGDDRYRWSAAWAGHRAAALVADVVGLGRSCPSARRPSHARGSARLAARPGSSGRRCRAGAGRRGDGTGRRARRGLRRRRPAAGAGPHRRVPVAR